MTRILLTTSLCVAAAAMLHAAGLDRTVSRRGNPAGVAVSAGAPAQGRGQGRGQDTPTPTPRAAAPIDVTGYWVSVVTEDWRWRMITPPKGDFTSVPLNPAGRRLADTWDPATASSDGCKAFGAAALMRVPGRLHVTWEGDTVLKIETDAGKQTRVLHFDTAQKPAGDRTWQGWSVAEWEVVGGRGRGAAEPPRDGALKVITTEMRAGYLRKNGVPYSEGATMTEYIDRHAAYSTDWLTVTTIVEDPQYLTQPFITSTHFKKEADGTKFSPVACE